MNTEQNFQNSTEARNDGNTVLPAVFSWKREGSFLDQIKDVWRCYVNDNDYYSASVKVDTINYCSISINGDTHKKIYGADNAKRYVESVLQNGR